jgi:hypothetical protein
MGECCKNGWQLHEQMHYHYYSSEIRLAFIFLSQQGQWTSNALRAHKRTHSLSLAASKREYTYPSTTTVMVLAAFFPAARTAAPNIAAQQCRAFSTAAHINGLIKE